MRPRLTYRNHATLLTSSELFSFISSQQKRSGSQSLRISREWRCLPYIIESKEELYDSVQAQTATGVWSTSLFESIDVVLEALRAWVNTLCTHGSLEFLSTLR